MADRAGYDQPGDGYTNKHATCGVDAPPPYEPGILQPHQGYAQKPYPMQQPYGHNTNSTVVVCQPQSQTGTVIIQSRPPDYMLMSFLACCCCFCPTGICAIYYADRANTLANDGDYEGARRMSNNARNLIIASVIVGIVVLTLSVVFRVSLVENSYNTSY